MGRQHKDGFQQRNEKHDAHHHGNRLEYFPHGSGDEIKGHEGHDVGQDAERYRRRKFARPDNGRFDKRLSLLVVVVDVLADNDGIVDHNAQGDDVGEHRHHVDADVHRGEEEQGTKKRRGDAHHDPEREAELEEEAQHYKNERQANHAVTHQELGPLPVDIGHVADDVCLNAWRQRLLHRVDLAEGRGLHLRRRLLADAIDIQHDGRFAVVECALVRFLEVVAYRGDIAQQHLAPVGGGDNRRRRELASIVAPLFNAQEDLAALGLDAAARQFERGAAKPGRDFVHGEAVFAQRVLGDFDTDFQGRQARDLDLGNVGILQ